jgi:hypothetical protein
MSIARSDCGIVLAGGTVSGGASPYRADRSVAMPYMRMEYHATLVTKDDRADGTQGSVWKGVIWRSNGHPVSFTILDGLDSIQRQQRRKIIPGAIASVLTD